MPASHRTGMYVFSLQRQAGTAAPKNYITIENPVGSNRLITLGAIFASYFAVGAGPAYPLRGYRCTGPAGGTLHTPAEVCKLDTAITDSVAVVRSEGPTTSTLDGAFFNSPSGIVANTVGGVHEIDAPAGFNPFLLRPGEAVVIRQDAGATNLFWNLSILWREVGFV